MKAFITGITGQDGSYLAELLLEKGYEVHGLIRRAASFNTGRIDHIFDKLHLHFGDLTDGLNIFHLIHKIKPQEIYNMGAQSHVRVSFDTPVYTINTIVQGITHILESVRQIDSSIKVYQASSSEMYGGVEEVPQSETTPFYPRSPYGCAKVFAYHLSRNYRESYSMFVCNGILFNHESERRGDTFVTKKITNYIKLIRKCDHWFDNTPEYIIKNIGKLKLGNLDAKRDWGYAPDYMEAAWLMLQQQEPDDYVIATGETHTVREFLEIAFAHVEKDYKDFVEIDPKYFRPTEVDTLLGDYTKACNKLGWKPKTTFNKLVRRMIK